MKELLRSLLVQAPQTYATVLRFMGNHHIETSTYLSLIRKGDVVFDVGANFGHYTLLFSHLVGAKGHVHAFEPVPPTFDTLTNNINTRKKSNNVSFNNTAVGDETGKITLYMPNNDSGQVSMRSHDIGSWQNTATVTPFACDIVRLDQYSSERSLGNIDFLKIDVEGAEHLVLQGMGEHLERFKPVIHLEICHDWTKSFGYEPYDIVTLLSGKGYTHFFLSTDNGISALTDPVSELSQERLQGSANLL